MTKAAPDILRALAVMAERHRLGGAAFSDACRREQFRRGRVMPDAVHHVVGLIADAGRDLTPTGVACVLRGAAGRCEGVNFTGSAGRRNRRREGLWRR